MSAQKNPFHKNLFLVLVLVLVISVLVLVWNREAAVAHSGIPSKEIINISGTITGPGGAVMEWK